MQMENTYVPKATCVCVFRFSRVRLCATPWTTAHQTPLSMGFSRQENWSGLPCPSPGDLPNQGSNPCLLHLLHWQVGSLPLVQEQKQMTSKVKQLPRRPLSLTLQETPREDRPSGGMELQSQGQNGQNPVNGVTEVLGLMTCSSSRRAGHGGEAGLHGTPAMLEGCSDPCLPFCRRLTPWRLKELGPGSGSPDGQVIGAEGLWVLGPSSHLSLPSSCHLGSH